VCWASEALDVCTVCNRRMPRVLLRSIKRLERVLGAVYRHLQFLPGCVSVHHWLSFQALPCSPCGACVCCSVGHMHVVSTRSMSAFAGVSTRPEAPCIKVTNASGVITKDVVSSNLCGEAGLTPPLTQKSCNRIRCPEQLVSWSVSKWSDCTPM
jgi:hypothetical protein